MQEPMLWYQYEKLYNLKREQNRKVETNTYLHTTCLYKNAQLSLVCDVKAIQPNTYF